MCVEAAFTRRQACIRLTDTLYRKRWGTKLPTSGLVFVHFCWRAMVMSLDDVLFAVIVGGVGLCAAYFRGEYIGWQEHRAAEKRREASMRALHIEKDADTFSERRNT
jgi:hypothetical protein